MIKDAIVAFSDFICGYPLFILLIGGGLFLFLYSGAIPVRKYGLAIRSMRTDKAGGEGQISSFQALMSAISSTVGMGNIAGVAIAIVVGGPGAIFWMWVSAILGMATKLFEGTLAIMYKGRDEDGEVQGGPMYVLTEGISKKLKPLAQFFCVVGMIGTLVMMQANQLAESVTEVFLVPVGLTDCFTTRLVIGLIVGALVSVVVLGGIKRISNVATKIVPAMVAMYFVMVLGIIIVYYDRLPGVFMDIIRGAFNWQAGFGAMAAVALTGARRAMYVNEAGVGTASLMHGASRNPEPVREGLVAMIGPSIDSGLVCTLSAIPILMAGNYHVEGVKGLTIALGAYDILIPTVGRYLLMIMVLIFAFSTMFSYSYYGTKCAAYLFGKKNAKYYSWFYILMIVVASIISLDTAVSIMDAAFALMAVPTMFAVLYLAPRAKAEMKRFFAEA